MKPLLMKLYSLKDFDIQRTVHRDIGRFRPFTGHEGP